MREIEIQKFHFGLQLLTNIKDMVAGRDLNPVASLFRAALSDRAFQWHTFCTPFSEDLGRFAFAEPSDDKPDFGVANVMAIPGIWHTVRTQTHLPLVAGLDVRASNPADWLGWMTR